MNLRVKLGWIATFIWVVTWIGFLFFNWNSANDMKFNEWGDFLAGASAPLAFLWLVIGYFQQGEELGQNTKALEQQEKALQLQVDELRQTVQQQKLTAVALGKQSDISGLMARLDATNHILESLDRQKSRVEKSNSADKAKNIREMDARQQKFEAAVEGLLVKIESLEDEHNG